MRLLYAAIAYMTGVALARWGWQDVGMTCPLPGAWWLLPGALLVLTPWLNHWRAPRDTAARPPLRWPEEAGFVRPGRPPGPGWWAALWLCLVAGCLRYASEPFAVCWTAGDLAYYNLAAEQVFDREAMRVTVSGFISDYPQRGDGEQELTITAEELNATGAAQSVAGNVRVTTRFVGPLHYGQRVAVTGRLAEPGEFDDFSYRDYLAIRGVRSVMVGAQVQIRNGDEAGSPLLRWLYGLRARGEAIINHNLAEPYAALANGILLGLKGSIPKELSSAFRATGTSHVLVISGTNVALIAGVIIAAAARLVGKRRAAWPALAAIALYALLVGGEASVLRAAMMGGLVVTATALRRSSTALVSLAAACLALTLANPLVLWDVGLHLSALATAGLILLGPTISAGLRRLDRGAHTWLAAAGADVLAVTLAANLMTLPLALYLFQTISLASVPANLAIAPLQPLILLSGSAALLAGCAGAEQLAGMLLWPTWLGLAGTMAVVKWAASLPLAALAVKGFGLRELVTAYLVIGLAHWRAPLWAGLSALWAAAVPPGQSARHAIALRPGWANQLTTPGALLIAGAAAALLWMGALAQPDGRLHVWFLDVGQGDAILIQTPSGRQVLIDGGAGGQGLLDELGEVMPFWDRNLDLVVLTHPDADHMAGQVEAAGRYAIAKAWETPASVDNPAAAPWRAALETAGAAVQAQRAGGWADLGDGVALWVLWPPAQPLGGTDAENENSLVAKLVYGDFQVLLTGDAGTEAERSLVEAGTPLAATVLKVAHHGSETATSADWLAAVQPTLAVIQVGEGNRYGHPSPQTLARLGEATILRTDTDGRIHLWTDGARMWTSTAGN